MTSTVVVAALGLVATVLTAWLTSRSQRRGERDGRVLEARVRIYGECAHSLYEYERATYNRVKARFHPLPHAAREELRQEAYHLNAQARATIGQVAILCDEGVRECLESVRKSIGRYNGAETEGDLWASHKEVLRELDAALRLARSDFSSRTKLATIRRRLSDPGRN